MSSTSTSSSSSSSHHTEDHLTDIIVTILYLYYLYCQYISLDNKYSLSETFSHHTTCDCIVTNFFCFIGETSWEKKSTNYKCKKQKWKKCQWKQKLAEHFRTSHMTSIHWTYINIFIYLYIYIGQFVTLRKFLIFHAVKRQSQNTFILEIYRKQNKHVTTYRNSHSFFLCFFFIVLTYIFFLNIHILKFKRAWTG